MKYSMTNLEITAPGEVNFKIENISIEYNCEELAQFAINAVNVIGVVKEAIKELAPVISAEVEKAERIKQSHRIERMEKEAELEKERV